MQPGYLAFSVITLLLGVACFLAPEALQRFAGFLERSVMTAQSSLIDKKRVRYLMGLLLLLVSYGTFRIAYLVPLFRE